eukprot:6253175-Alexandrium_andersonii.AAC.1
MVLLHANLEDSALVDKLSRALCLSPDVAPLSDIGLDPSLDLPEPAPLFPERRLSIRILGDLLSPNRAGHTEIIRKGDLGDPGTVLALQPGTTRWRTVRIVVRV